MTWRTTWLLTAAALTVTLLGATLAPSDVWFILSVVVLVGATIYVSKTGRYDE